MNINKNKILRFPLLIFLFLLFPIFLSASEPPLFLFHVDSRFSNENLADLFETTPQRIQEANTPPLSSGTLRLPNRPPHHFETVSVPVSPSNICDLKKDIDCDTLKNINKYTYPSGTSNILILPSRDTPWGFKRLFYEKGFVSFSPFFYPITILLVFCSLFLLYVSYVFLISLFTSKKEISAEKSEKKPSITVEVLNGGRKNEVFHLTKETISLGRSPENDLSFPTDGVVSGRHLEIYLKTDGWFIKDLNSTNGIIHQGRQIHHQKISPEDVFELGIGGLQIRLTPFTPKLQATYGGKGTTYIARVVSSSVEKNSKMYRVGFGIVVLLFAILFIWNFAISERLDIVETKVESHERSLEKIQSRLDSIDKDIENLQKADEDAQKELSSMKSQFSTLAKTVARNTQDIADLQKRIENLPSTLSELKNSSEKFTRALKALSDEVEKRDNANKAQIEALTREIRSQAEIIKINSNEVAELREKIERGMPEPPPPPSDVSQNTDQNENDDSEDVPEKKSDSSKRGGLLVQAIRIIDNSLKNSHPVLSTGMGILRSLVDNEIVLTLSDIAKDMNLLPPPIKYLL